MNKFNKILVVCPSGVVTGWPEALHQLVSHMNSLRLPAYIVYLPFDNVTGTLGPYKYYKAKVARYEDVVGNLIIFPEINPNMALKVKHAKSVL